jgi:hypothetical protein
METLSFDGNVVTPEGTPLGGSVHVEVSDDGSYLVKFHMHSSSLLGNFDFNLRAYLTAPGFATIAFIQSGHVSGVDSWDHDERGSNPLLALYWGQLKAAPRYSVAKDYKWGGVVGTIEDLVKDIFDIGAGAIGDTLGVILGATREAIGWLGTTLGAGGTIGVIGGVVVFAIGTLAGGGVGGALVLGLVAGVAIGAVTNAMIKSRPINDAEIALAKQVFGETIPYQNVVLTNLGGLSGRAFTAPGADGKTYCNLGKAFDDPLGPHPDSYPNPGQLLIHELTHAWQIAHNDFLPGLMCSGLVNQTNYLFGDNVYEYGPPGPDWNSGLQAEQQGSIVDQWFAGNHHSEGYFPMDQENVYYRYIWQNILARVPSSFAPGNLRSSPSFAVGRKPANLDVFWVRPDGALATQWAGGPGNGWADHQPLAITPPGAAQAGSGVAAVSRLPDHIDIFWVRPDGAIATHWWDIAPGSGWFDHQPRAITPPGAAQIGSAVAAVSRSPNRLDVFWVRPDGAIATQWWPGPPGSGWDRDPFAITPPGAAQIGSAVAVVSRLPIHLDVFWVRPDGAIGTQWWDVAPGLGWADHAPFAITPPGAAEAGSALAAVSHLASHLDIFWVRPDGAIGTHWWDSAPGSGWGDHQPFAITPAGAAQAGSRLAAVGRTPDHLDVFWVRPDGAIGTHWWDSAPGSGWVDHQPFPITPPGAARAGSRLAAVDRTPNNLDVFWVGPDGAIATQWWFGAPGFNFGDHQPFPITPPGAAATTFPIAIDATRLFFRFFMIPGVTDGLTDARRVQVVQFVPGKYNYQFQSGVQADFTFTVTPQGTVDYDHSCDAFLGGRSTATLQVLGLEVTLDALPLTGADNRAGLLLASVGSSNDDWIQRRTVRLLPQNPYWVQQGGLVARIAFGLQRDGRFSYGPELDTAQGGPLAGAGTTTLTFKGHAVSVDATAVSRFLLVQPIGAKAVDDGKATIVVLPADGFTLQLDRGITDLVFSVDPTGKVTLGPAMRGRLEVVPASPPVVRVLAR